MTKRLRIGFLIDDSLDRHDGVQQYVATVGKWLERQGYSVAYFAGETKTQHISNSPIESLSKNIPVIGNKNRLSIPLWASKSKALDVLKWYKPDILHVQSPFSPVMSGRVLSLKDKLGFKVVSTFHIVGAGWVNNVGTKILGSAQRQQQALIDKHIFVSHAAKDFSKNYFKNPNGEIIPNAVDVDRFRVKKNISDKSKIVFLGRLVERKGCEYLIHAFNHLKCQKRYKNLTLTIAGTGPREVYVHDLVKQYALEKSVTFLGYIDEAKKPSLLASAGMCVFPSLHGESFGIVLLEAMATGALVIGGNNPGYSEVLDRNELILVDPRDTASFAEKIANLLDNDQDAKNAHNFLSAILKTYDINAVGPRILAVYEEVIKKH